MMQVSVIIIVLAFTSCATNRSLRILIATEQIAGRRSDSNVRAVSKYLIKSCENTYPDSLVLTVTDKCHRKAVCVGVSAFALMFAL
jgi:hypothetical protein